VAFAVALQGIQVRFGRSVVTIMGVVLGIAFLMAILTGQVIKLGVSEEQALRLETRRMYNFLVAEMGTPRGRVVGAVVVGELNRVEARLLARLAEEAPEALRVSAAPGAALPGGLPAMAQRAELPTVAQDAHAVLVLGAGQGAGSLDWAALLKTARYPLVCLTHKHQAFAPPAGMNQVQLERDLRQEELDQQALEAKRARARNIWIVVISMLVTVIGITNSMLMSVTERFREIGTMKCLGALSHFIRQLFLIESSCIGLVGAVLGAVAGLLFSLLAYTVTYGAALVFTSLNGGLLTAYFGGSVLVGLILSVVAAIYPAHFASRMLPAHALRSNI